MNDVPSPDERQIITQKRVIEFLDGQQAEGKSQRTVASLLGVPEQYLSDFRAGRRRVSESVGRRIEEAFGVQWQWLLGQSEIRNALQPAKVLTSADGTIVRLPVLPQPIEGDPQNHSKWDGTFAELIGASAVKAKMAKLPYVLRFGADDAKKRVSQGDLLLMSQATLPHIAAMESVIQVIRQGRRMYLARREGNAWIRLASAHQTPITESCTVHGHAIGIIWGSLT